jgi:Ser/Thr protein kinase RdoA (MazF antagonist)
MQDQVPNFDDQAIAQVAMNLYCIEGDISPLVSYEDQNALIETSDGSYVLKIAMQGYTHSAAERPDDLWNLDNVIACKVHLDDVSDEDTRARIKRTYATYGKNVLPKLPHLRKSVIHGDINEQNLLVASDKSETIAGLIDFGEIQFATQINELAITLAYALLNEDDLEPAASNLVQGYRQEFEIEADELDILLDLAAMRLVQSLIMTSHSAREFPDNSYLLVSQQPARVLLKKLEEGNFKEAILG